MPDQDGQPTRIQRTRSRGWRMPAEATYVGRGSRWGNPFRVGDPIVVALFDGLVVDGRALLRSGVVEDRTHAVDLFQGWFALGAAPYTAADIRSALVGRDLACWCPLDGLACHGDPLLEIANTPPVARHWDD